MTLQKIIIIPLITILFFAFLSTFAYAQNVRIAVLVSLEMEPYKETISGFQQYLNKQRGGINLDLFPLEGDVVKANRAIQKVIAERFDIVLTLGTLATDRALEGIKNIPIIAGLVLRADKLKNANNASGVILEFPLEAQFEMLRRFLPKAKSIGVIYNPKENSGIIGSAASISQKMGLKLDAQKVYVPQDLPIALDNLSKSADVLWGVPDNLVLTPQTTRHLLLFSYRNRIPFIGLSTAWVKAGALYSLDRDYRDIGRL